MLDSFLTDLKLLFKLIYEALSRFFIKESPPPVGSDPPFPLETAEVPLPLSEADGEAAPKMITLAFTELATVTAIKSQLPGARAMEREDYFEEYLLTPHRSRVRELLARHQGRELAAEGNTFFVMFDGIIPALQWAVAVQTSHTHDAIVTPIGPLQVKIGIYSAKLPESEASYHNSYRHYAALLSEIANGGQIVLPGATAALIDAAHLADVKLHRHSEITLKGLNNDLPVPIFELLYTNRKPQHLRDAAFAPNNLPPPPDLLLGRAELLAEVREHLQAGRITILKGEEGVGKTALALAAAHTKGVFRDGIAWLNCELKFGRDESLRQIANVFFGDRMEREPINRCNDRVVKYLREHDALVVFDSFNAIAGDARLLRWLSDIRNFACILITTHVIPPDLQGEVIDVPPLPQDQAVAMLIKRASARGWSVSELQTIEQLCNTVAGAPLAIELLAARIEKPLLLLQALQKQIDDVIKKGANIPPWYKNILACFALSYDALTPPAQELLLRLAVLPNGADDELMTAFTPNGEWAPLAEELTKGFLCRATGGYYTMNPIIRRFAIEHAGSGCVEAARSVIRLAIGKLEKTEPNAVLPMVIVAALDWIEAEWRNLLACAEIAFAAGEWALVSDLSYHLFYFWTVRGYWSDAEYLYKQALAGTRASGDQRAEARSLHDLGVVYQAQGRWAEAETTAKQGLAIQQRIGDRYGEGYAMGQLADVYGLQGRWEEAEELYHQRLTIARELEDHLGEGRTLGSLGNVYRLHGRWTEAEQMYKECLRIKGALGDRLGVGYSLGDLGMVYEGEGRWPEAEATYLQSLEIIREFGNRFSEREILNNLSSVYRLQKRWKEAESTYQKAIAIQEELGDRLGFGTNLRNLGNAYRTQRKRMEAEAAYQQNKSAEHALSIRFTERETLKNLGDAYQRQGRWAESEAAYQQSLATLRAIGDRAGESRILESLGNVLKQLGKGEEAEKAYQKSRMLGITDKYS